MKLKVLITDHLPEKSFEIFRQEGVEFDYRPGISYEEILEIIDRYHGIITRSRTPVTKELLEKGRKLRVVGRAGVGVDSIDIEEASRRGILVVNTAGGNRISVAELTIGHMIACIRGIPYGHRGIVEGKWYKKTLFGHELYKKNLGIIGLGRIGSEVARRALAFGMNLYAYDPYIPESKAEKLHVKLLKKLDDLLKISDIITIHAPLTEETRGMISHREFSKMKDGVVILNIARGGIIDHEALFEAVKSGKVGAFALDVYPEEPPGNFPLKDFPFMSLTPHIGANTQEAMENVASMVVSDVINALRGREVKSPVNFPLQESSATPFVKSYKKLAERMGKLFPALFGLKSPIIEIELLGTAKNLGDIVKAYFLKGLLSQITDAHVNEINAPYLAREKGIEIVVKTGDGLHNFKNIIIVKGYNGGKNKIAGSVFDEKYYRILNIKDFWFEIEPRGELLFFETIDMPGIIGEIGYKIASRGYNISDLRYFTRRKFGLGILKLDRKPEKDLIDELKSLDYITNVAYVSL